MGCNKLKPLRTGVGLKRNFWKYLGDEILGQSAWLELFDDDDGDDQWWAVKGDRRVKSDGLGRELERNNLMWRVYDNTTRIIINQWCMMLSHGNRLGISHRRIYL